MKNIPAFPLYNSQTEGLTYEQEGMTLLDYFAGQALTGLLTDVERPYHVAVQQSYQIADRMLKEREKWIGEQDDNR